MSKNGLLHLISVPLLTFSPLQKSVENILTPKEIHLKRLSPKRNSSEIG